MRDSCRKSKEHWGTTKRNVGWGAIDWKRKKKKDVFITLLLLKRWKYRMFYLFTQRKYKEAALFLDHIRNKVVCIYTQFYTHTLDESSCLTLDPPLCATWIQPLRTASFPKTFHRLYKYSESPCFFFFVVFLNKHGGEMERNAAFKAQNNHV